MYTHYIYIYIYISARSAGSRLSDPMSSRTDDTIYAMSQSVHVQGDENGRGEANETLTTSGHTSFSCRVGRLRGVESSVLQRPEGAPLIY